MSANQSLYQMEHPARAEEWVDFNDSFKFATGYLESNPPSLDSISPKDLELVYSDADALNWDSEAAQWPQSAFSDLVTFEDPLIGSTEMPSDMAGFSESIPPPPSFPEMECSVSAFDDTWSSFDASMAENFYSPSTYRQLIESQAAADPRCFSKKEKRLEASIALHLQRLQDAATADLNLSSDSCGSLSSPCWPESAGSASESQSRGSPSSTSPCEPFAKSSTPPSSRPSPLSGGVELVLDLNMNTTTNLPKKQKPRSQAQKENYIKVRKHGACEKHRKQHKRCNCLDKSASRVLNNSAVAALAQPSKARLEVRNTGQNVITATKRLSTSTLSTLPPAILDRNRAVKSVPGSVQPSTAISPTVKTHVQHVERSVYNSAGRVNTVIPPTISTNVQPSRRSAHNSAGHANTALSWTPTSNASVMERIVQNPGGRAVISVKSPVNVQRSECSAKSSAGRQNSAHAYIRDCQSPKEARPWRTVDTTSSVPGPLVTQNTQTPTAGFRGWQDGAVRAVHFSPGLLRESSGVLRPFRHKPTFQHEVGKVAESQSKQANKHAKGKEDFWFNSWTWSLGSRAEAIQNSTVAEYAGAVVRNTALAFSAFWQSSTSVTSWAGVLLGRLVLSSSRQHMLARKGMGVA
ncbi:hypothetical protein CNMCM5793_004561 [Aspergillus hiratsukae]|uniref:Uncharacterized protein n=1 Tax=Aspergillus hiratsukae TaxID=1194566 RepID=A0A8H6PG15_9EURO|nr:hypothetical protein CNMCM5793_004561 [Aspergillus hiratsukae]